MTSLWLKAVLPLFFSCAISPDIAFAWSVNRQPAGLGHREISTSVQDFTSKRNPVHLLSPRDDGPEGARTGNWTTVPCTDPAVANPNSLTPKQRWSMMDGNDAWKDVINVWKTIDRAAGNLSFTESISNTVRGRESVDCGALISTSGCDTDIQCTAGIGWGAAGYEVFNSLVAVHKMYENYSLTLTGAANDIFFPSLPHLEDVFAPIPPPPDDDKYLQVLLDLVGLGAVAAAAPFFEFYLLADVAFFAGEIGNVAKDVAYVALQSAVSIAKDLTTGNHNKQPWTTEGQHAFSDYMGQVVFGWQNVTAVALRAIFSGTDDAIDSLSTFVIDGKMIEGSRNGSAATTNEPLQTALEISVARTIFGFAIPALWAVSNAYPFIIDSNSPCGTIDPLGDYLSIDNMRAAHGCYNGRLYYLAAAKGSAQDCPAEGCINNLFPVPPGLGSLDGTQFGSITVGDLINGSVRTYQQNNNQNGGSVADPTDKGTFDNLYNGDITTPGYVRIPVCSPDDAFKAWEFATRENPNPDPSGLAPNYPCSPLPFVNDCGDSTFVDQTSDGSPTVDDCRQLAKTINIDSSWHPENGFGEQHELINFGTCKFGVQAQNKQGNVEYNVGGQDVIDIINASIQKFGGSGKVGAKGEMKCQGNVKDQDVEWGLY